MPKEQPSGHDKNAKRRRLLLKFPTVSLLLVPSLLVFTFHAAAFRVQIGPTFRASNHQPIMYAKSTKDTPLAGHTTELPLKNNMPHPATSHKTLITTDQLIKANKTTASRTLPVGISQKMASVDGPMTKDTITNVEADGMFEAISKWTGILSQQDKTSTINDHSHKQALVGSSLLFRGESTNQNDNNQDTFTAQSTAPYQFQMKPEEAKELDKSILNFETTEDAMAGLQVLPTMSLVVTSSSSSMAARRKRATTSTATDIRPPQDQLSISFAERLSTRRLLKKWSDKVLSKPSRGRTTEEESRAFAGGGRINRDIREVAVSIASNIDNLDQWKVFYEEGEGGGLEAIFQSLKVSSRLIAVAEVGESTFTTVKDVERAFATACTACRSLRDLCALSPELSAIVTEAILDASSSSASHPHSPTKNKSSLQDSASTTHVPGGVVASLSSLLNFANQEANKKESSLLAEKARLCRLYVIQLFLAMSLASDAAVYTLRATPGVKASVLKCSSFANYKPPSKLKTKLMKLFFGTTPSKTMRLDQSHVIEPETGTLDGRLRSAGNQLLAALGHNVWVPKSKNQRGLRILCLDGGGTRGIAAITSLQGIVKAMGGVEVCDAFDIIAGTSTGAIISFLVALRRESAGMARKRYDMLIKRIFVKSPLSTPMLVFTTASYDESHFIQVMEEILGDDSMLESRGNPRVPYVFAVSTKMSSTPTTVCLFRNYNYSGGELPDAFVIDPDDARREIGLPPKPDSPLRITDKSKYYSAKTAATMLLKNRIGSRNPGSFRIPQKVALRTTTAAPTVFKPVLMGGELYCDGGMVASNPTAIAIHEARTLFNDVPIDCVVSLGTGGFLETKSSPRIGWDGIITQIVNSATDAEQPHHILEDILGQGNGDGRASSQSSGSTVSGTKYYRFNPIIGLPDDFPLDNTDTSSLDALSRITRNYMKEPEQARRLEELAEIMVEKKTREQRRRWWFRSKRIS